jgi:hypothetical protein
MNIEIRSSRCLKMEQTSDTLNIQDDHPTILFGPRVEENSDAEEVPPFYVSLKIHDMTLHNAMLDSGASHNLMPKVVMDQLGLDITRPYKDLFSFDSRKVKCLGLIKDLVVSLAQIPTKNMVMDVVVVDIPPKFGMLLSRSWAAKLKGTLQMDMSYATIPVFGQDRRLYREVFLKYMVTTSHNRVIIPSTLWKLSWGLPFSSMTCVLKRKSQKLIWLTKRDLINRLRSFQSSRITQRSDMEYEFRWSFLQRGSRGWRMDQSPQRRFKIVFLQTCF